VHGFGNAGAIAATLLSDKGYLVVAVADSRDAIFDPRGLDVARLREVKERTGRLGRPTGARVLSPSELLELEVDVLVPASLEGVIADVNAAQVSARVILELANGPVTPSAEARLTQRGTVVIPDVLANAGGVTVSYFEWVSGRTGEQWTRARVDAGLIEGMSAAADEVFEAASDRGVTMRTAAFGLAIQRLDRALGHQTSFDDDARDLALASA
jgi:glutamate dehydrogenase/leucine dehydrogenase